MGIMSQVRVDPHEAGSQSDGTPLLGVKDLSVYFERQRGIIRAKTSIVKAVDKVSFNVRKSEIMSLVGESGSGKTTVARCIAGLVPATSGSIIFNGSEVATETRKQSRDYRKDVQIIFQDPFESLNPRHDAFTAVSIPLERLAGLRGKEQITTEVIRLLEEVGLDADQTMRKLPHQLSGGERQRVSIARALASNPRLLIADEPITMLDASQRLNILSLIMDLKIKRDLTVLLITHDLASARAMSDTTAVMYRGRIVEVGPTETILSRPAHPYTEMILEATPRLSSELKQGDGFGQDIELGTQTVNGCIYLPRCKYATSICKEVDPQLLEKSPKQFAACHNALNQSRVAQ
jgi:oligopeptide/dipeptide ABC transporter ATP-binding protein